MQNALWPPSTNMGRGGVPFDTHAARRRRQRAVKDEMDSLQEALTSVGAPFDEERRSQFDRYCELVEEAAGRLNVTGARGVERIREELVIRSLRLLASAPGGFVSTTGWFDSRRVLDVGSGAGIPGIALKIACPGMRLALLDSSSKKCAFLERVVAELSLADVEVINARAEEAAHLPSYREHFDIVVSRGVAALPELAELTLPFAAVGGTVVSAKGLSGEREIVESEWAAGELGATPAIRQVVDSPGSSPPDLLVYWLKVAPTPDRYPRRTGVPHKRPIMRPTAVSRS